MSSRLIIDGNAVYVIDEECMKIKMEREEKESIIIYFHQSILKDL